MSGSPVDLDDKLDALELDHPVLWKPITPSQLFACLEALKEV